MLPLWSEPTHFDGWARVLVPRKGIYSKKTRFGRGFLTCRTKDGSAWTAPGAIKVEGGSIGFQAGGAEVDVVLLVMNRAGINKLLGNKFTIGADASGRRPPRS